MIDAIEVYAGTGTLTRAIRASGLSALSVDIEDGCDVRADALTWEPPRARFVWASPPCPEFSASSMPWHARFGVPPSLAHVHNAIRIIRAADAALWIIENVRGASQWLTPLLGEPQCFGSIFLWHNFPRPIVAPQVTWKTACPGRDRRARAKLPDRFAAAVAAAVVEALQPQLWEINA